MNKQAALILSICALMASLAQNPCPKQVVQRMIPLPVKGEYPNVEYVWISATNEIPASCQTPGELLYVDSKAARVRGLYICAYDRWKKTAEVHISLFSIAD